MSDLSVIVPMHNAEAFLPTCLATLRANDADGRRFILVDDASTDQTPELLERAASEMPGIRVLTNSGNVGAWGSRNAAHALVDTRYITYLDVDDWLAPGHLDRLEAAIVDLGVDVVRTDHVRVDGLARTLVRAPERRRSIGYPAQEAIGPAGRRAVVDYPFLWAGIYDVTRIGRENLDFDATMRTAADRPWFWRLYMTAGTAAVVDLHGVFYRKTANVGALTQAGNESTLHIIDAFARVRDLVVASGREDWTARAAASAADMVTFHVARRARLSPELRRELYRRAGDLLRSFPDDARAAGVATLPREQRAVIRRILGAS
ncbi:glycosyltransferase family 2 protein [Demequina sp.]|uniref:glycosyltransferase family 2 protein n=1 Tax=Demequina sp. TaxID=2050685 RepID=UPI0026011884|nr:glycosyltransferase family 2 protein [Demequina sp.]